MAKDHRKNKIGRRIIKIMGILLGVIILIFGSLYVANKFTPQPFAMMFKSLNKLNNDVVKLGDYQTDVESIVEHEPIMIPVEGYPDAKITIYDNGDNTLKPLVYFIHGGGWIIGDATQLKSYSKLIASRGYTVAALDYSLAPKYEYPTPIYQAIAGLNYLNENAQSLRIDNTKIFVGGNSAGAQISAQLGSMITNKSDYEHDFKFIETLMPDQLKGLVLLNGVYNFDTVGDAGFPGFDMFAWSYTGTKKYQKFERIDELSTLKHVNQDFPQSFITVGDADPLRYQSFDMENKLKENDVSVTTVYWTGSNYELNHDYFFDLTQEPSKVMFESMIEFLNTHR